MKNTKCNHCKGDLAIRNPKGFCDHLYYPENCEVCRKDTKIKPHKNQSRTTLEPDLIVKSMPPSKIKPDCEKDLKELFVQTDWPSAGIKEYYEDNYKRTLDFIRNLLAKKEEQHKAVLSIVAIDYKNALTRIDKLKQQHREELEGLMKKEKEIKYEEIDTGIGTDKLEYDGQEFEKGYNKAVRDNNEAITNLLEQKGK